MAEIDWTDGAEQDFVDSFQWYAGSDREAAESFEAAVQAALQEIGEDVERFSKCDARHQYCWLDRYPFRVIFRRLPNDRVLIVAIAHSRRRPGYWAKR